MPTPATESHEQNLYLRIQNSTMSEAMHDVARRLGFVYLGAQGFAGAVHRAVAAGAGGACRAPPSASDRRAGAHHVLGGRAAGGVGVLDPLDAPRKMTRPGYGLAGAGPG